MEAKIAAGLSTNDVGVATSELMLNPFVHHLELGTTTEKIKTAFFTVVLLPIRVFLICVLVITGWLMACVALWGVKEEDLQKSPVTGWRSHLKVFICHMILATFYIGGIRLKVTGAPTTRAEAPVVALAPHSSFMDSLAMVYLRAPSIVAKAEVASIPFFGSTFRVDC